MMNDWRAYCLALSSVFLTACMPIDRSKDLQYQIDSFSCGKIVKQKSTYSLLVSQPASNAGYQTEQMLYTDQPYVLRPFAHSAWVSSPAQMLYPLMLQSLQHNHY